MSTGALVDKSGTFISNITEDIKDRFDIRGNLLIEMTFNDCLYECKDAL